MRLSETPIRQAYKVPPVPPSALPRADAKIDDIVAWDDGPPPPDSASGHAKDAFDDDMDQGSGEAVTLPSRSIGLGLSIVISAVLMVVAALIAVVVISRVDGISPAELIASMRPKDSPPKPAAKEPAAVLPPVSTTGQIPGARRLTSRAWGMWRDGTLGLFDPPEAISRSFTSLQTFAPGLDIIDGATLQSETRRIHLSGIVSLAPDAVCLSDQSTKFACGLMARASLSVIVSGQSIRCYPDVAIDTETPSYICQSHGRDVSLAQLDAGFALPANRSIAITSALAASARERHAGAWNGDWTIVPPPNRASVPPPEPGTPPKRPGMP